MGYPLVNRRAMGSIGVFGAPKRGLPFRPALGATADQIAIAKFSYDQAVQFYQNAQASYPSLVTLLGQPSAEEALDQAATSVAAAADAYNAMIGASL